MKRGMSLKECYAMLGVQESAPLDDIKRAYRKRAFELHPDLNPDNGASRRFQQLNEAYVVLIRLLDIPPPKPGPEKPEPDATSAKAGRDAYREQARQEKEREEKERRERREKERQERQEAERRERERREREEKERREQRRRDRLREEIEKQEAERLTRKEKAREEKERQARMREEARREHEERRRREAEPKAEAYRHNYSRPGQFSTSGPSVAESTAHDGFASAGGMEGMDRESLLNDLLNDPFARRVYEDIYSEVQQRKSSPLPPEPEKVTPGKVPAKEPAGNFGDAVKGWLRGQIDEKQELFFPAQNLYPGAKFRLKIRPGLSGDPRTVEVTLPPDFVPGKPVRLRGMGKKVGKWQGDLYLTFQIKS